MRTLRRLLRHSTLADIVYADFRPITRTNRLQEAIACTPKRDSMSSIQAICRKLECAMLPCQKVCLSMEFSPKARAPCGYCEALYLAD